jgi:dethiobiotin synthetase
VLSQFHTLQTLADVVIVEGAGGWYAPLNAAQTIADLAQALQLPVILVVSI